jgi:hypothetical protein
MELISRALMESNGPAAGAVCARTNVRQKRMAARSCKARAGREEMKGRFNIAVLSFQGLGSHIAWLEEEREFILRCSDSPSELKFTRKE